MAITVDTRGLSCPQPVLMAHEQFKKGERELDVLVDNEASRENVARAAKKQGLQVTETELDGGTVKLELRG